MGGGNDGGETARGGNKVSMKHPCVVSDSGGESEGEEEEEGSS